STGPAPTGPCTLSLHDALPISARPPVRRGVARRVLRGGRAAVELAGPAALPAGPADAGVPRRAARPLPPPAPALPHRHALLLLPDRKSTRLNSSHVKISYAVFC